MGLFYQHSINEHTKLAVWKIAEDENFFLEKVPAPVSITKKHKLLQHLAGRWLLQLMVPDFPFKDILIANTRKPFLPYEQYHFSISHCGDYAAAIVSTTKRVGIDIEISNSKVERIRHKFLHADELQYVENRMEQLDEQAKLQLLTLLWSCKEAVFKWWSYGSVDFSEHIRLWEINSKEEGKILATFMNDNTRENLDLFYKIFPEICLVWVIK